MPENCAARRPHNFLPSIPPPRDLIVVHVHAHVQYQYRRCYYRRCYLRRGSLQSHRCGVPGAPHGSRQVPCHLALLPRLAGRRRDGRRSLRRRRTPETRNSTNSPLGPSILLGYSWLRSLRRRSFPVLWAGSCADGVTFVGGPLPDFLFAGSPPALFSAREFCLEVAGLRGGVPPCPQQQ